MEVSVPPQSHKMNLQTSRKSSLSGDKKDLWFALRERREGSLVDVESALILLKKNGGNINLRNAYGLTPLHIAIWRNHILIVRRLLAAGADLDARDGESGWSSLHGANYQLGTGNQDVQKLPRRVDSLHGCFIKLVSASKFHSVAVSSNGEVYTWRFDIHR